MEKRKIDLNTINIPKSHALFDYYIKDILELFVCQVSPTLYRLIDVTRNPIEGFTRYFLGNCGIRWKDNPSQHSS